MAKSILIDEIHVMLFASSGLNAAEYRAIRRTLIGQRFLSRLRAAVREVVHWYPSLRKLRMTVGR